ncbi:AI-2E family transporter [Aequorivita ciconiae]|uniref:AI-2E family transporter n=1 Tax=Aequorivita ciconiae TaxID=2494375 RepID=UPI0021D284B1|nr:AI-2E family transporter [Aequorivita sp. H23M31]
MPNTKVEISGTYVIKFLWVVGGIVTLLYIASGLLMPLVVAAIIAILLDKPHKKMLKWGFPNWLAITLSILLMLVIFSLLTWLIGSQIGVIGNDWPTIREKGTEKLNVLSQWTNQHLNWDYKDYVNNNKKLVHKAESLAKSFLSFYQVLQKAFFQSLCYWCFTSRLRSGC